jgi:hypothetical protein
MRYNSKYNELFTITSESHTPHRKRHVGHASPRIRPLSPCDLSPWETALYSIQPHPDLHPLPAQSSSIPPTSLGSNLESLRLRAREEPAWSGTERGSCTMA